MTRVDLLNYLTHSTENSYMERLYRRDDLTVTLIRLLLVTLVSLGVVFGIKV